MEKAGPRRDGLTIARDREGHLVASSGSETSQARLLWKLDRQQECLNLLESVLKHQETADLPILGGALRQLSEYRRQRGEEWQPAYVRDERVRERADQDMIGFCSERLASKWETAGRISVLKSLLDINPNEAGPSFAKPKFRPVGKT